MRNVIACIDGSASSAAVCDYATWASLRLDAPLHLLHVLDRAQYPQAGDLSGSIGLGSREHLLDELAALDEQRGKLAREQGQHLLDAVKERAIGAGVSEPYLRQRHGNFVESLTEMEDDIRLVVIGKRGEESLKPDQLVGSQLESTIRSLHRPILVAPLEFTAPRSVLLAFDASANARRGVETIASSPLLKGLPIHLVTVSSETGANPEGLAEAESKLKAAGFDVQSAVLSGDVEPSLHEYQAKHEIDLLAMGAYGHSWIREFLLGSTTNSMLRTTTGPLLLLR